jgi:transposase
MYIDESYAWLRGKRYKRILLRESYRQDGKVKKRTLGNLSHCSEEEIAAIKFALGHKDNVKDLITEKQIREGIKTKRGFSIGAIYVLYTMANRLGIMKALGNSIMGKLALWQIMARIIDQGSRLSAVRLASQHAVCDLMGLDAFNEDRLYENLDWLYENQEKIEKRLFAIRHFDDAIPTLYLYDVTSSYLEGQMNELGQYGYNRDGKRGKKQIVIGLLTDEQGDPVSVEVFSGNTSDPATFCNQINKLAYRFGIKDITMVGDRGMIKSCQIKELDEVKFHYITAITKPQIQTLIKERVIQLELFSEKLCEVEYESIRYILRRNPLRSKEIANNRMQKIEKIKSIACKENEYLAAHKGAKVDTSLKKIRAAIGKLKVKEFCNVSAQERSVCIEIDEQAKENVAILDGCYVIKTDVNSDKASAQIIHDRYKDLANIEQGFRTMKTVLLETRPINVRKAERTRAHVFVVMLAYIISRQLKKLWANINLTVQESINELASITSDEIKVGTISYQSIPEPRDLSKQLLEACNISLPAALPFKNVTVATRKKLMSQRKSK